MMLMVPHPIEAGRVWRVLRVDIVAVEDSGTLERVSAVPSTPQRRVVG
jgi:hypothetical protein